MAVWETQPGSATSPLDYQYKSGNTTIPAGETMVILDWFGADLDMLWDNNEYYDVVITGVSAGTIGDGDVRVNIGDTSPDMLAVMDGYYLESDTLTVLAPAGLLVNDTYSQSHHQSIEVTVEPLYGTVSVSSDGSFTYNHTDDNHYGYDSFTYRLIDKNGNQSNEAFVQIDVARVNMAIYDGQSGAKPGLYSDILESLPNPVDWETTRGAFTVANKNDTNGDGTPDNAQAEVLATTHGTNEVDLMRLQLYKPRGYVAGTTAWLSIDSGSVYVWDNSTKDGLVPLAESGGGVAVTWTTENPIEWWVEALDASTAVRDIRLTLTYDGSSDSVKATGVWVELTAAVHQVATAQQVFAAFPDITSQAPTTTVRQWIEYYGGVGMRPFRVGSQGGNPLVEAVNVILLQWTASPSGLSEEPVNIDIARREDSLTWIKFSDGQILETPEEPTLDEVVYDKPNDDGKQDDESAWKVTDSDHIYNIDAPGYRGPPIMDGTLFAQRGNFWEFARIDFENKKPQGNGVSGSRASAFKTWHVAHKWNILAWNDWRRTTGDDPEVEGVNSIGPGHITIGEDP